MKKKIDKKKGIVLWVTGISGSGKTTISKLIYKRFQKKYGPTVIFQGDELRSVFQFKDYSKKGRINNGLIFSDLIRKISDQKINVIISVIGMFDVIRKKNRQKIKNYIEIFINSKIKDILKKTNKKHYKYKKNIVGLDIKLELPKNPEIKIMNDFTIDAKILADRVLSQIFNLIK